ncbi:hypothetical protein LPJ64_004536 [Coemansia asiatica]|uniref:Uncharacterized protein n=1 Tax=Coemansia asiatica TaxID=1052880 RepID=A0A9W7XI39_9FUNG|nr:hypothetical protein LPJ64_004536 [Coemansia asiatica]
MSVYYQAPRISTKELLVPVYSQHSARHSRSSSTSTMVSSPILLPMAAEPLAFLHPPLTPSRSESPASPHATTLKNTETYRKYSPVPFTLSARRDSLFGAAERPINGDNMDFDELDIEATHDDDDDDTAFFVNGLSSWDEGVFQMDVAEVPDIVGLTRKNELCSDSLAFKPGCRPKPWSVRPLDSYDSDDAQIRAIDDDDNEFYF